MEHWTVSKKSSHSPPCPGWSDAVLPNSKADSYLPEWNHREQLCNEPAAQDARGVWRSKAGSRKTFNSFKPRNSGFSIALRWNQISEDGLCCCLNLTLSVSSNEPRVSASCFLIVSRREVTEQSGRGDWWSLLLALKSDFSWSLFFVPRLWSKTFFPSNPCKCLQKKTKLGMLSSFTWVCCGTSSHKNLVEKEKENQPKIDQFISNVNRGRWLGSHSRPNSCRPIHLNKLQPGTKAWPISVLKGKWARRHRHGFSATKTGSAAAAVWSVKIRAGQQQKLWGFSHFLSWLNTQFDGRGHWRDWITLHMTEGSSKSLHKSF